MAKSKNNTVSAPKKSPGAQITLAKKAKKVLQSNGLHYFRTWAEESPKSGVRGALKSTNPTLFRKLVAKGEALDRKMDRPPEPKEEPKPSGQE
jgi:hypothetical protein